MVQGHVFLRMCVFVFVCVCVCVTITPIYFLQGLSFLHLEITLPFAKWCYAFEEKLFFLSL